LPLLNGVVGQCVRKLPTPGLDQKSTVDPSIPPGDSAHLALL
jgi:hypothetical protein